MKELCLSHDMMYTEMEVYVKDMIAKSKAEEDHRIDLQKIFERLRKYGLKLNLDICVLGVTSKLLGFIMSQQCSEIDSSKIKAITEMPTPRTGKESHGLSWWHTILGFPLPK